MIMTALIIVSVAALSYLAGYGIGLRSGYNTGLREHIKNLERLKGAPKC